MDTIYHVVSATLKVTNSLYNNQLVCPGHSKTRECKDRHGQWLDVCLQQLLSTRNSMYNAISDMVFIESNAPTYRECNN